MDRRHLTMFASLKLALTPKFPNDEQIQPKWTFWIRIHLNAACMFDVINFPNKANQIDGLINFS